MGFDFGDLHASAEEKSDLAAFDVEIEKLSARHSLICLQFFADTVDDFVALLTQFV
jgi:hypothetical protein